MPIPTLAPAALSLCADPPAGLIEPQRVADQAETAVAAFFHEGQCPNTARTYKTALHYWGAWHALRFGSAIASPVAPAVVSQFILDHLEQQPGMPGAETSPCTPSSRITQHRLPPAIDRVLVEAHYKAKLGAWSMATIETRLAALSWAHEHLIARNAHLKWGPEKNPLRDPRVRQLISAARRTDARRGREPARPLAATRYIMEALLASCGDDLIGKRDRALLLFGWASGGRRRSEIVAASFENVRRDEAGFVYQLDRNKANLSGRYDPKNLKPIRGAAAVALEAWMQQLLRFRITHGPLFRRILNDRIVEPLKPGAVREIIRRRAQMVEEPLGKLSAHSLRSGFVNEAGRRGIALGEIMAMTGHRSAQTVLGYYRSADVATSRAARLLDADD
jgi:integrase